jgi:hypothetical protein
LFWLEIAFFAKDIKRDGKGAIAHYPPIEENDLTKMYEYFDNTSDNVKLQQNVFVDIMLYFLPVLAYILPLALFGSSW